MDYSLSVSSTQATTNGTGSINSSAKGKDTLGQDAFLQILVAQLKYQDPLQPMQDREFISQMALFSAVQQLTQLNQTVTEMKELLTGTSPTEGAKDVSSP